MKTKLISAALTAIIIRIIPGDMSRSDVLVGLVVFYWACMAGLAWAEEKIETLNYFKKG